MKIERDRQYITRDGRKARVVCNDIKNAEFPVIALVDCEETEVLILCTKNGYYQVDEKPRDLDLVAEYSLWLDVAVDTPILVKNEKDDDWEKRHFAKYENGKVWAWLSGYTSWSAENEHSVMDWKHTKLAEKEDNNA